MNSPFHSTLRIGRDRRSKSPARSKSPVRSKSPARSRSPMRSKSPARSKSSKARSKSPAGSTSPALLRSPAREKSPANHHNLSNVSEPAFENSTTACKSTRQTLNKEVLEILGQRTNEQRVLGPKINEEFALHFSDIIKTGLPKDEAAKFIKKYPPPKNFTTLDPPKLNPEVELSVPKNVLERDQRIVKKQEKLAACLSACSKAISHLLNEKVEEHLELIEMFTDTGKLLADVQHDETNIRRSLIAANINPAVKDTIKKTDCDILLFGPKLDKVLETASAVERIGKSLKPTTRNITGSKNSFAPPRQPPAKKFSATTGGGSRRFQMKALQKKQSSHHHRSSSSSSKQYRDYQRSRAQAQQ